jgi:hypothetical protein
MHILADRKGGLGQKGKTKKIVTIEEVFAAMTLPNSGLEWAEYIKLKIKHKISLIFFLIIIPCSLFCSMEAIR